MEMMIANAASVRVRVGRLSPAEWSAVLSGFDDANIYQTWAYGSVRWGESRVSHLLLEEQGAPVAAAQLSLMGSRRLGCGIAYLRWGPLLKPSGREADPVFAGQMAAALHEEYVRKRGFFLRIVPSAFAGSAWGAVLQQAFVPRYQCSQAGGSDRTMVLDLTPSMDRLRASLDQKWRNQLNRAEKNGLDVEGGDDQATYETFLTIYREMLARKQFKEGVSVEEFGRIQRVLPPGQKMKVLICLQDRRPVAGLVCSALGDTGIYLLGATSDAGMKAKGAYLLQWQVVRWLKERGCKSYDLGGVDPERNPGVYHFKSGLSGSEVARLQPFESCQNPLSRLCALLGDVVKRRAGIKSLLSHRSRVVPSWNGKPAVGL